MPTLPEPSGISQRGGAGAGRASARVVQPVHAETKSTFRTARLSSRYYDDLMKRTVNEIMSREVNSVHPDTPLTRVLQLMVDTRDKSLPVVDDKQRLVGMISRGDIVRAFRR